MANEIGHWEGGASADTRDTFVGDRVATLLTGLHTGVTGETVTRVRIWVDSTGGGALTSMSVGLFATTAGYPTGAPVQTATLPIAGTGENAVDVSWALTNGVVYCLAAGNFNGTGRLKAATLTAGMALSSDPFTDAWSGTQTRDVQPELAGDITAGGPTTITPARAALTLNGRAATVNTFTSVAIREVLINEAGSPVTDRTGISLLVWYGGSPAGAPDLSISALTTDAAGTASWSLPVGGLVYNQAIFYVATDGGASLSQYTCARLVPTYT